MTALIGRDKELETLKRHLADAISGKGSSILISGEPGIGKTALVQAFKEYSATQNVKILPGAASADSAQPFLVFSKALAEVTEEPLFEEQEYTHFLKIFAINHSGMLVAQASSQEADMDADIFAGMLSAVQNFVGDSLGSGMKESAGLGRLEYGDMKILIEHGQHLFLTGVFSGNEHKEMKNSLKRTLENIENEFGTTLEKWSGKMSETEPIRQQVSGLIQIQFLVRRDLENLKLENEHIRIADKVLDTLMRATGNGSAVLLLEDLHWADASSLFVLNYLARNVGKLPILVLGTIRPGESGSADASIESMTTENIILKLTLNKLGRDDVAWMIKDRYPENDFPPEFLEGLAERCGGTPLFVIEFLKQMDAEGSIVSRDGRHTLVNENLSIPDTVEDLIQGRLSKLGGEALAVAEYASCIGRAFEIPVLNRVSQVKELHPALAELQGAGIIIKHDGVAEFSHAMYQDALYSTITPRWRATFHKSIGEHYESATRENLDKVLYELAHHFSKTSEHSKGLDYSIRAAEKAAGAYAADRAILLYEQALDVLARTRMDEQVAVRGAEINERLGELYALSGRYVDAVKSYTAAGSAFRDQESKARTLRRSGDALGRLGNFEGSLAKMAEAEAAAPPDSIERWRVAAAKSYSLMKKGDYDTSTEEARDAIRHLERIQPFVKEIAVAYTSLAVSVLLRGNPRDSLAIFQRCHEMLLKEGDSASLASSYNNLGNVYYDLQEFDQALEVHQKGVELKKKVGDRWGLATSYYNMGLVKHAMGDLDAALGLYVSSLEIAEKIGDASSIAMATNTIGFVHYDRGELREAQPYFEKGAAINEKIGDPQNLAWSLNNMGLVHQGLGDLGKAGELYLKAISIQEETGDIRGMSAPTTNMGDLSLEQGKPEQAVEWYAKAEALCKQLDSTSGLTEALAGHATATTALGELEEASKHLEKAEALSGQDVSQRALNLNAKMKLLSSKGDGPGVDSAFREYEAIFDDISPFTVNIARYTYGMHLASAKKDAEAAEKLNLALSFFDRNGMTLWAERCRAALEGL